MPSKLRNLLAPEINRYRIKSGPVIDRWGGWPGDETCGLFYLPYRPPRKAQPYKLRVIISGSEGWDHVSVSLPHRCPTWEEMEFCKRFFFQADAVCYQLHVAESEHLSAHPYCLHIWRSHDHEIALPPPIFVAPPQPKEVINV